MKVCILCHAPISESRPPYLVGHHSGRITGPYHAGCAEKLVLAARRRAAATEDAIGEQVGFWPLKREESMPW